MGLQIVSSQMSIYSHSLRCLEQVVYTSHEGIFDRKLEGSHSLFYCYFDRYWRK